MTFSIFRVCSTRITRVLHRSRVTCFSLKPNVICWALLSERYLHYWSALKFPEVQYLARNVNRCIMHEHANVRERTLVRRISREERICDRVRRCLPYDSVCVAQRWSTLERLSREQRPVCVRVYVCARARVCVCVRMRAFEITGIPLRKCVYNNLLGGTKYGWNEWTTRGRFGNLQTRTFVRRHRRRCHRCRHRASII